MGGPGAANNALGTAPKINLTPSAIRGLAGWVIEQCVSGRGGIGGYATGLFENVLEYIEQPSTDFDDEFRK